MSLRKRLGLMLSALVVAVMAFGAVGSAAWFTDQETLPVSATAAKLDIDLRGTDSASITLSNLAPGVWSSQKSVEIFNQPSPTSALAVKYRITSEAGTVSVSGFLAALDVRVRHTHCGTPNPEAWPIVYDGNLGLLDIQSNATSGIIATTLAVNTSHCFYFEFKLDETAGNEFQGATGTFDLVFDATQPENPGWAE